MKKLLLAWSLLLLLACSPLRKQRQLIVPPRYEINIDRRVDGTRLQLIGTNRTAMPVQLKISWADSLQAAPPAGFPLRVVLPPLAERHPVASLPLPAPLDSAAVAARLRYRATLGDPGARHDETALYELPYLPGKRYEVIQTYFDTFSHADKRAIDFAMRPRSVVCAARAGIVARVKSDSKSGGCDRRHLDEGNYVTILHADGTFANYFHLHPRGTLVVPGDTVATGDPIGLSGDTGFSCRPHLHFIVYQPVQDSLLSVPTRFRNIPDLPLQRNAVYGK